LASLFGSGEKTIRRNYEFAKAVDKIREEKPEAAERIFRGEVKDALTALPQVAVFLHFLVELWKVAESRDLQT